MTDGELLVCSDCGHPEFKWDAMVVQTGGLQTFSDEQYEAEQVTSTVTEQSDMATCTDCGSQFERSELTTKQDYEQTDPDSEDDHE